MHRRIALIAITKGENKEMTDSNFYTLWSEAIATPDRDIYVAEWSTSSIFPDNSNLLECAAYLSQIWDVAHMDIKTICKTASLTQVALAKRFCIPLRTVQNWYNGQRQCADYIRLMTAEALGILQR